MITESQLNFKNSKSELLSPLKSAAMCSLIFVSSRRQAIVQSRGREKRRVRSTPFKSIALPIHHVERIRLCRKNSSISHEDASMTSRFGKCCTVVGVPLNYAATSASTSPPTDGATLKGQF